jgi:hypothetical protein
MTQNKNNISIANNNNDPISLITSFANSLLQMQQQQIKLTIGFINTINNNNNLSNIWQNTNNNLNINNVIIGGTKSNELNYTEINIL